MENRVSSLLGRNVSLVLIPIVMDLTTFFLGLMTTGFWGESKLTFKLILNVGIPSIAQILEQNIMAGALNFNIGQFSSFGVAIILFLVFFIAGAFIEAGFIGLVFELAAKEQSPTLDLFMDYAQRFWVRMLGLRLIILVITLLGMLLAIPFSILGALAFMIFIVLRIRYIYWEFTIVSEDMTVAAAFQQSRRYYEHRTPELTNVIIAMVLINFLASLLVNLFWSPLIVFLGIFIYNYIATGLQLALMDSKPWLGGIALE